jgi:hypothetical protein
MVTGIRVAHYDRMYMTDSDSTPVCADNIGRWEEQQIGLGPRFTKV